jgi:hypothetical protein
VNSPCITDGRKQKAERERERERGKKKEMKERDRKEKLITQKEQTKGKLIN